MIKRIALASSALALGALIAAPASATALNVGTSGVVFSAFDISSQGTLLDQVNNLISPSSTFTGNLQAAVYRNTGGTLDFYYQFTRTGGADPVERLTAGNFSGYTVDAMVYTGDADAGSLFTAATMIAPATAQRSSVATQGSILTVNFDQDAPVWDSPNNISSTYIFRTNAVNYTAGLAGAIDQQTANFSGFQPAAVPEPASWALMVGGFGMLGAAMRRRRPTVTARFV